MKLNCETHRTIEFEGYRYNVLCIEQNGTFDYYLQKVGYGDLMHICGLEKNIALPDYFIGKYIDIAIKNNFWME